MTQPSIFLSHSHRDREFVRRLALDLSRRGAEVWVDQAAMFVGDSLLEKIQAAIGEATYFGIVLSRHSINSDWVQREAAIALQRGADRRGDLRLLPILLNDVPLPSFADGLMVADFRVPERYGEAFDQLIRRLGLPDDPSEFLKARAMRWPLPEFSFEPTRVLRLHIAFYDGQDFVSSSEQAGILVTDDSAFVAELPWDALARQMGIGPVGESMVLIAHYESRSWLPPKNKLRDDGVKSGEHLICVFGPGTAMSIGEVADAFQAELLRQAGASSGRDSRAKERTAGDEWPEEMRLLDEIGGLIDVGRSADAMSLLERARGMKHGQPLAWYYTGRCYQLQEDYYSALRCFERALQEKPSYPAALVEVGYCLNELGRPKEALTRFQRALELEPGMESALINTGVSHERLGEPNEALRWYETALDYHPLSAHPRQNKGAVLLMLGRIEEAAECFRDVLRLDSSGELKPLARRGLTMCGKT